MAAVGGIQDTSYLYSAYEWVTEHPVFSVTLPLFTAIGAYFSTSGEYLPLLLLPIVWYNTVNQETRVNRVLLECQEKNRALKAQLDPQPKKKTSCDPRQLSPSRGFLENPAVWIRSHPISTVTIPAIYYYGSFVVHKMSTLAEYPTDGTLGTHFVHYITSVATVNGIITLTPFVILTHISARSEEKILRLKRQIAVNQKMLKHQHLVKQAAEYFNKKEDRQTRIIDYLAAGCPHPTPKNIFADMHIELLEYNANPNIPPPAFVPKIVTILTVYITWWDSRGFEAEPKVMTSLRTALQKHPTIVKQAHDQNLARTESGG